MVGLLDVHPRGTIHAFVFLFQADARVLVPMSLASPGVAVYVG
jgi:hypothetical protein